MKSWSSLVINQSRNSCHRVASDHGVNFSSASQPKEHDALWPCTTSYSIYTWPLPSAKTWCPCSPDALVNKSVFCTALRLDFGRKTATGLSTASYSQKQWDTRPQELYFIAPRSWWGLEQSFGILIGLWLETDRNVHHYNVKQCQKVPEEKQNKTYPIFMMESFLL